ncbi:MAG TPA: YihY/virulence factor BrkB family protein [Longimicrobiaceae bacterium]|nr:YihY/virulence factor BrkB family protein [Longimicrobiaceae bacterium]
MASGSKGIFGILKRSISDFLEDESPTMAAALSYYTVFSLPPLLLLIIMIVGAVMDPQQVREALQGQLGSLLGQSGGDEIRAIIEKSQETRAPDSGRPLAAILGVLALVFGATGAFGQLQAALNRAWEVKPDPHAGGIKSFIVKRVFSFGMILGIAFLLMVSLALSAAISAFGNVLGRMMPGLGEPLLHTLNFVFSLVIFGFLFAAMFKILPDAVVAWRDVWVGALVTTLLFVVGKFLIGFYLGRSNPGEVYGAAGSLAVLLVWIYYASMIVLFGAEFTQVWAEERGGGIRPEPGAVRVVEEERIVRDGGAGTGPQGVREGGERDGGG